MTMREQDQFSGQGGPKDTVELAQTKVTEVKDQLQAQASHLVERAQEQATSQIAMQKEKAVSTLGSVAGALRQTSQTLRDQDQAPFAQFADKAAEQIDNLTSYLQNHEPGELVHEVERFARRQPALFIGGAFVLGLLGARFLKSSAEQQREMYGRQYGYGGPSYGGQYRQDYGGQYHGQYGEQNTGQYGGQYVNRQGGQYGGEQYTSYPRTYENESSFQSGSGADSTMRSRNAGEGMLFESETEER